MKFTYLNNEDAVFDQLIVAFSCLFSQNIVYIFRKNKKDVLNKQKNLLLEAPSSFVVVKYISEVILMDYEIVCCD